jgi:hypothetical protein
MNEKADFDRRDTAKLASVSNPVEAQVLESLLADEGIPCEVRTWHSHAYDGIFEPQRGYAELRVFKDDLERARVVLADFQQSLVDGVLDEDQDPEPHAPGKPDRS